MRPQKSNRNHPLRHDNSSHRGKLVRSAPISGGTPSLCRQGTEGWARHYIILCEKRMMTLRRKKILLYHFGAVERRLILEKEGKISSSDLAGKDCKPVSHLLPFYSLPACLHCKQTEVEYGVLRFL